MRLASLLVLLTGCGSCGDGARVDGPHPYVRCALREPSVELESYAGVSFSLQGRVLDVRGLTRLHGFAVGEGSRAELPDGPVLVLGGFARNEALAESVVEAIGSRLAFFVPGGEDDPEVIDEVLDEPHHVDLRGVHVLATEGFDWLVLPGAPDGRYALGDASCGYGDADVEALRDTLEGRERPRVWLSWNAPAGIVDLGFEGARVGDPRLDLASGGVFAFPATHSGPAAEREASLDHAASVPRWGGFNERHDGAPVAPGVLEIHVEVEGLRTTYRPL